WYVLNKKKQELKLTKKDVESFILYIILGVILGARLFEVLIWNPVYYFSNPLEIFAVWKGGLSLHGGLAGAALVLYFFCKKYNIKFLKLADILVLPGLFALAVGRIANFINAELVGTVTNAGWCVKFPGYEGCRHPVQLYASAGRFILLGYLAALKNIKKFKDGFLFWNFILFMGIGRFITDFLRDDPRVLGLSMGQYLSIVMVIVAGYVLIKYYKKSQ
ncbi:prolipoprotein diacylglyceryl transferase, partial [Candidatus Woesearchaeota archaeon]|nr:prolipoprotein diacylglyceryl transferase [Candidatus Woesearchaeota archaeon]